MFRESFGVDYKCFICYVLFVSFLVICTYVYPGMRPESLSEAILDAVWDTNIQNTESIEDMRGNILCVLLV